MIGTQVSLAGEEVNAKDVASKFTVQSIASTSFGIEANQFDDSPQGAQFYQMTRKGPCIYDVHIGRKRCHPKYQMW